MAASAVHKARPHLHAHRLQLFPSRKSTPPPTMPPPPPSLPDDLVEEIFLRLPPDEPEWLVRASLASKLWLGRLTSPRFHARHSEFHGAPPMLGFVYSSPFSSSDEPPFVPTTKFRVCIPDPENKWYSAESAYDAWDSRHGRVLLGETASSPHKLLIWDPKSGGCWRGLEAPGSGYYDSFGVAVLCAVDGCDHRACHDGPSRVVFVGVDDPNLVLYAHESSPHNPHSHLHQWSEPGSGLHLGSDATIQSLPPVLIQHALYFMLAAYPDVDHVTILKYDLSSKCLSLIDAPLAKKDIADATMLVGMEDRSSLGFAHLDGLTLNLWSSRMGSAKVGSWTKCRVIDLKELLPVAVHKKELTLIGYVESGDIIFITTKLGIHQINLKSLEWKKIWKNKYIRTLFPYMSFYYPQGKANPPSDAAH